MVFCIFNILQLMGIYAVECNLYVYEGEEKKKKDFVAQNYLEIRFR